MDYYKTDSYQQEPLSQITLLIQTDIPPHLTTVATHTSSHQRHPFVSNTPKFSTPLDRLPLNHPSPSMTTQAPAAHSSEAVSRSPTVVDLASQNTPGSPKLNRTNSPVVSLNRQFSNLSRAVSNSATAYAASAHPEAFPIAEEPIRRVLTDATGAEIKLSQGRKWFLLLIFSVAQVSVETRTSHLTPSTPLLGFEYHLVCGQR